MRSRGSFRRATVLLLLALLTTWLPGATPVPWSQPTPPLASAAAETQSATPPVPLSVPPVTDPHLPSLSIHSTISPDPIAIGETAVFTLTLVNDAPDPALDAVLTLPTPDGALALGGPVTITPMAGWQWTLPQLEPNSQTILSGTLRLVRAPAGDAVLLHPQLTARGLTRPVETLGGAPTIWPTTARPTSSLARTTRRTRPAGSTRSRCRASHRAVGSWCGSTTWATTTA